MQTYKRGTEFTGYILLKCSCGKTTRYEVGPYWLNGWQKDGKTPIDLNTKINCKCGKLLRLFYGKPLYGKFVSEVICNAKCTGAIGHHCECSCGGKNHGGQHDYKS